ncbi:MAG: FecR domain-containing protein [Balneola sp.]
MRTLLAAFLLCFISFDILAQEPVSFSSDKLQQISQRYAGSSLNWPVVVSLAEHNITNNTFTLSGSDILKLRALTNSTIIFENQQKRTNQLISEGATIFATNQLNDTNTLFNDYLDEIRNGNLENALNISEQLKPSVDALERTLNSNRLVSIQAQLISKDGLVDKRLGLLAGWKEAFVGDLFEESHGVRTQEESYATLAFTDGSNIIVNPSTTAIIRKSRIDKLDESADAEITLVEGGLLSKLSAVGKERSKYILNAGSSTTELNTQNFLAENSGGTDIRLSNYDGDAHVSANNVIVTIRKDEGTIIRGNQAPLPPVKLLPAPRYLTSKLDTIIYQDDFLLNFDGVEKAVSYRVEYSSAYNFDGNVLIKEILNPRVLIENLPLGTTYVRIQSVDDLGLKGPFTEKFLVIRNQDTKAPPIFGDQFNQKVHFVLSNSVTVTGVTEPDAIVLVNGKKTKVSASGTFSSVVSLESNDQIINVTSTDGSQNTTRKELRVVHLTEPYLFKVKLDGLDIKEDISSTNSAKTITGRAFPEMEVELKNGQTIKTVKTDSQGRWGVTMNVQQGKLSITFKANQTGIETLSKSYTVK